MSKINLPPKAQTAAGAIFATLLMVGAMNIPDGSAQDQPYPTCQEPGREVTDQEAIKITTNLGIYAKAFFLDPEEDPDLSKAICTEAGTLRIEEKYKGYVDAAEELVKPKN